MNIFKMQYLIFHQFTKFSLVGIMNTAIDFIILNLLIWITHIYRGDMVSIFNSISFSIGIINSYIWNKNWTFRNEDIHVKIQFIKFFSIAIVGLILNTTIVYYTITLIKPIFHLSMIYWINIVKIFATMIVVFWNFIICKYMIFKCQ